MEIALTVAAAAKISGSCLNEAEDSLTLTSMLPTAPVKLIYVAGYGRSGSTLLDIALGQHPHVLGAGEIMSVIRFAWENNEFCACGSRIRECSFWSKAMAEWTSQRPALLETYRRDQERTESIFSWARITRRLFAAGSGATMPRRTAELLSLLSSHSGKPVIVDSSKLPGRGLALAPMAGVDMYVVHLVRDPRAVVWSMMKMIKKQIEAGVQKDLTPKPFLKTALRWMIVNLATEVLLARVGRKRSLRLRYEDFVSDPAGSMNRILELVGECGGGLPDGITTPFRPQHQGAGSRHRMQKQLGVSMDERWRTEMPRAKQWAVALCCAPLLVRYGYRRRATPKADLQEAIA